LKNKPNLSKLNPAVPKHWLILIAGIMWSGVGILLGGYAVTWLLGDPGIPSLLLGLAGIGISLLIYRFGFSRVAHKNMNRIDRYSVSACFFSFQAWTGYVIIAVMMTAGILLKHSAIPKPYLAVLYSAIGGGLLFSSFLYYARFAIRVREYRIPPMNSK
jgi:hypothetical protein